jgi:hypothetical protein
MADSNIVKFSKMGISFNKEGQVTQCPHPYTYKQEKATGSNNWHVSIFQEEREIVHINTKTTTYECYCIVHWK